MLQKQLNRFHDHIRRQTKIIFGERRKLSKKREMFQGLYIMLKDTVKCTREDFMIILTAQDAELKERWKTDGSRSVWEILGEDEIKLDG